jgi:Plavaka transposase
LENPWAPFRDRLGFDWAYYHYVRLQSSKLDILEGLNLWSATVVKHESMHQCTAEDVPWHNADALYETIDAIQAGDAPWKTYKFSYMGPKPSTPPAWMEKTYELNTRDALLLLEQQIAMSEFDGQVDYVTYQEFDSKGDCIFSNLMSGDLASHEAVCLHVLSV